MLNNIIEKIADIYYWTHVSGDRDYVVLDIGNFVALDHINYSFK